MSQQTLILDKTFEAGADLSSYQYYFVYLSDDQTVALCTTAHLNAIGVLQNQPKSGEAAEVRLLGTTKTKVGEAIAVGKRIKVATDGMGMEEDTADATEQYCLGVALEASTADGDIIEMLLQPFSLVKGTA